MSETEDSLEEKKQPKRRGIIRETGATARENSNVAVIIRVSINKFNNDK